jgi:hypothetical protein
VPGYKVAVYDNGALIGYAQPAGSGVFSITPTTPFPDGVNFLTARVVIADPRTPTHAVGFGNESSALVVRIITATPDTLGPPDLTASSDTGGISDDNITTVQQPTFVGTAAPNAIVRILANGVQVGQGVAGSSTGHYQITVGSLDDGVYAITATQEDLAGNVSSPSSALKVTIAHDSLTLPGNTAVQGSGPVTVDLNVGTISGYLGVAGVTGKIGIVGIPQVNLDTGNRALIVRGTNGDDNLSYRPTGPNAGNITDGGTNQRFVFSAVAGLTVDAGTGNDIVTLIGTQNPDSISSTVDTTAVTALSGLLALQTVTANLERIGIASLNGSDTISVTIKDTVSTVVTVDAGDPATNTPNGDLLRIADGSGKGLLKNGPGGAVAGSGSFIMTYPKTTTNQTRIDYSGVEKITKN